MHNLDNMIELKKHYPSEYHWLINAFKHYGFKYYPDASKTKNAKLLEFLSINPKLPVFAHTTNKPWLDDYVQFSHDDFDLSVGDTTLRFYDTVMHIKKGLNYLLKFDTSRE